MRSNNSMLKQKRKRFDKLKDRYIRRKEKEEKN